MALKGSVEPFSAYPVGCRPGGESYSLNSLIHPVSLAWPCGGELRRPTSPPRPLPCFTLNRAGYLTTRQMRSPILESRRGTSNSKRPLVTGCQNRW